MNSKKIDFKKILSKSQKLWILLIVMLILTILQPGVFLTAANMKSILLSISIYGIMVCGTIFPILLGGIDLSVGAVAAAAGAFAVVQIVKSNYSTSGVIIGVLGGLLLGVFVGLIHGIIVSKFDVPAFLITLASQNIVYGVAQLLTKNNVIPCMEPASFAFLGGGRLFGIPFSIIIMLTIAIISYVLLNKTVLGRNVYAVGGNAEACRLSGVKSKKIIILSYITSGFTAAMAGIVLASMNRQAIAKAAQGYDNYVLTALVVGGASLMGGEGSIIGAIWGAFLVGVISNGLRLIGVTSDYHGIVKCIVIVAAVAFDAHIRHKNSGLQKSNFFFKKGKKLAKEGGSL
ncbi:ribose transport system permease protein [Lachnotalea glycerini]|jgi:ribose/xylose/arabinose/galactoside ABC-type transport system permease subunit|uniref:ABC transporter permease n=1 Tax=Lachnotalea glycerini TaxID=1763509 RepID=A0A255IT24_9FIRM|nr:ABC transporter permease [Lachnotalea glycerini]PXV85611.1 ribose transport system permease protein [Lachnotalea glycerini]RDY31146.1 ABC transporter permease [Lachnotalea glycerini]